MQLEVRLSRPYFFVAPCKGAERAATRQSMTAEVALAQHDQVAASSIFDLDKLYESVDPREAFASLIRIGVPRCVALLLMHLY